MYVLKTILGDDFLMGDFKWSPYESKNCGRDTCDYPREICMRDIFNSFKDESDTLECKKGICNK